MNANPRQRVAVVGDVVDPERAAINGRFCWIDDPLQAPIPSWEEPSAVEPWRM